MLKDSHFQTSSPRRQTYQVDLIGHARPRGCKDPLMEAGCILLAVLSAPAALACEIDLDRLTLPATG
jgi:hypothetical protein